MIDVASGEFVAVDIDHDLAGVVPISFGRTFNTRFLETPLLESLGTAASPWLPFGIGWRPTWLSELRQVLDGFLYKRADGKEFSIPDPRGVESFAEVGRIRSVVDGLELQRVDATRIRVVSYGRDRSDTALLFERFADRRYRLCAFERAREARVDIVYDLAGRPSSLDQRRERRSYELVHTGERVTRVALHLPDRTTRTVAEYVYDAHGRLTTVQDSRGIAVQYEYDDENRIVRHEKRGGSVYAVRYGSDGRCTYACGSEGYEERALRYDLDGRKTWVTDSRGGVTLHEWNERGQIIKTTSPCGVVTRAEFDDTGRPLRETSPNGILRERTYDAIGRLQSERETGGRETRFAYDDEHRLVAYEESVEGEVINSARLGYDDDHNVSTAQRGEQPPWQYVWSPFKELVEVITPSGARTAHRYGDHGERRQTMAPDGQTWQWTRDALGRLLTETNPLGHTRYVEYLDDDGSSFRLTEPDGRVYVREVSRDERSVREHFPGKRVRSVERSYCGQPIELCDEEGAITRIAWGTEPGELRQIANASGIYSFTYDLDRRIVERRTFDGRVLRNEWNGDRIAATYDGAGRKTEYEFNAFGLLTSQTSDDGTTTLEYDKRLRVQTIASPSSTLRLYRDEAGRVVGEEQDGIRVDRTLDVMGRPTTQTTSLGAAMAFEWTEGGRCAAVQYGVAEISFERDGLGRETRRTLGRAGALEHSYDALGRLSTQSFRAAASGLEQVSRSFDFDERGFLATVQDSLRGPMRLLHSDRGDLTGVVRQHGQSDFYAYDANRNRVFHGATEHGVALAEALEKMAREQIHGASTPIEAFIGTVPHRESNFGYSNGNRVVVIAHTDSRTELTYDATGQVVEKTKLRGSERLTWRYGWNARGELTTVTTPNEKVWTYAYDAVGRRTSKRSPTGDIWRYVWTGAVLLHTLKNGALVETYVHEPGGKCPILRDDGAIHFILPDQNNSPSEEVSTAGTLEWFAKKGTWGEAFNRVGAAGGEPFLGQWYDMESELHYNYFRYYDPETGRYMSPDPIDLVGGLNCYYTTSDPSSHSDRFALADDAADGPWIWRGVSANHPAIEDARQGIATPANSESKMSEEAHNLTGDSGASPFTSWTHDKSVALYWANREGPGGVLLRVRPGAPPEGAAWSWHWSPDEYCESEVLMRGKREGIEVLDPC